MQNRSALWIFTVLLALACLYQISFSLVTSGVESEAELAAQDSLKAWIPRAIEQGLDTSVTAKDSMKSVFEDRILKSRNDEEVYPIIGHTYQECKDRELVQGLDLKGGMSVILEVKIPDLIRTFAANKQENPTFKKVIEAAIAKQSESEDDFITLFDDTWQEMAPSVRMTDVFLNREYKDKFLGDDETVESLTNDVMVAKLREKAEDAISSTERILRTRIDKFGVTQPNIQKQGFSGRIIIELPGVKDKERVRKIIQSTANLEFWETYDNVEIYPFLVEINNMWAQDLYPNIDSILAARLDTNNIDTAGLDPLLVGQNDTGSTTSDTDNVADLDTNSSTGDESLEDALLGNVDLPESSDTANLIDGADGYSDDELRRMANPLWTVMVFPTYQDQKTGQTLPTKGCQVGWVPETDTARVNALLNDPRAKALLPLDCKLLWGAKSSNGIMALYAIRLDKPGSDKPPLDGTVITDARQDFDQLTGEVVVNMSMDGPGTKTWGEITGRNIDHSVAVVMDGLVYSAPNVISAINTGSTQITMGGDRSANTIQEAQDLANVLKAGSLPAKARIVDEAIVGPSLGEANVSSGIMSFIIALALVLVYMMFYYSKAGVIANIALVANIFFLFGALASLQAALTLPGIAGIVLTIGMSVDANVLIFERIREEIRAGKGMRLAVKDGYSRAYAAIIDANLTTLLTAIVLFVFGTGPIKGFATTLIIGIFTSLFSAIFITRLIFMWQLDRKKNISFATGLTKNAFTKINWGFIRKRKIFYFISGLVIVGGIVSLSVRSLNYGVEFTGGRSYVVEFAGEADKDAVADALKTNLKDEGSTKEVSAEVKRIDQITKLKITTNYREGDEGENVANEVDAEVLAICKGVDGSAKIISSREVDATISDDIRAAAMYSVIFALIVIFLYILIRFRKWQYGLGALLAVTHDVLVVLGLFSIGYGILPFSMEIDQAFIAAILTVVGYSINDTVVVFDRIREYVGIYRKKDEREVVNSALNSTLSRTFNTSISTFLVLLIIFLFGGESIKGFTFALMVGVVVGTYSSLFIATPVAVDLSASLAGKKKEIA